MTGHPAARPERKGSSRERTKSRGFGAPKKGISLSEVDEKREFVHPEGGNNSSALLNYHHNENHARFFTNQRPSITGSRSLGPHM